MGQETEAESREEKVARAVFSLEGNPQSQRPGLNVYKLNRPKGATEDTPYEWSWNYRDLQGIRVYQSTKRFPHEAAAYRNAERTCRDDKGKFKLPANNVDSASGSSSFQKSVKGKAE